MKRLTLAILLLTTAPAVAEEMPEGCYVAYAQQDRCWIPADKVVNWYTFPDKPAYQAAYGAVIGALTYHYEAAAADLRRKIRRLKKQIKRGAK